MQLTPVGLLVTVPNPEIVTLSRRRLPTNPLPSLSTATHCSTEVQSTAFSGPAPAIGVGAALPVAVGSNVTCCPAESTAVHWLVDGHATPARKAVAPSTAVHWLADGHATPSRTRVPSTLVGVGLPGAVGSNVTCRPALSTAVHWLADGHATALRVWPESIAVPVASAESSAGMSTNQ